MKRNLANLANVGQNFVGHLAKFGGAFGQISAEILGADFREGDATKHVLVKKKGVFSEKAGGIQ